MARLLPEEKLLKLYKLLWDNFGPRGWWPLLIKEDGFTQQGYHPGIYDRPKSADEIWEVCCGAVLAQNTSWNNVFKALGHLKEAGVMGHQSIIKIEQEKLAELIRSSGYYNQKAKKLKILACFMEVENYLDLENPPTREKLLSLWGIGPETADSILLYAYHQPFFVIDAYTRRVVRRFLNQKELSDSAYNKLADVFARAKPKDIIYYQEFHALIVRLCAEFCTSRPECLACPLNSRCLYSP